MKIRRMEIKDRIFIKILRFLCQNQSRNTCILITVIPPIFTADLHSLLFIVFIIKLINIIKKINIILIKRI